MVLRVTLPEEVEDLKCGRDSEPMICQPFEGQVKWDHVQNSR
jgi:hypothetical protein